MTDIFSVEQSNRLHAIRSRRNDLERVQGDTSQVDNLLSLMSDLVEKYEQTQQEISELRPSTKSYKTKFDKLSNDLVALNSQINSLIGEIEQALKDARIQAFVETRPDLMQDQKAELSELYELLTEGLWDTWAITKEISKRSQDLRDTWSIYHRISRECEGAEGVFSLGEPRPRTIFQADVPMGDKGLLDLNYLHFRKCLDGSPPLSQDRSDLVDWYSRKIV